eukprot:jgi/Phyca11/507296/fgenesh2_kg.PHYCAscaffold_26_\
MKSILALKDNACKDRHKLKVRSKKKTGRKSPKSKEHRLRYRLRRRMRFTYRKATYCVNDLHQKLSCWLSENYNIVLLPSFQTQEMLLKYKMKRTGGRVVDCEEEYTSKTCSSCGVIKTNLGGDRVFQCANCHAVFDRDVSAAKNILHKNFSLLT